MNLAGSAEAYTHSTSRSGARLHWAQSEIVIDVDLRDMPGGMEVRGAREAVQDAVAVWVQELPVDMGAVISYAGARALATSSSDKRNVLRWVNDGSDTTREPDALAVTFITYNSKTGRINDADIVVNAVDVSWTMGGASSACSAAYDLQNVLAHEVGHLFGLGHSEDEAATMFASAAPCETHKRDLGADDVIGLRTLYEGVDTGGLWILGCASNSVTGARGSLGTLLLVPLLVLVLLRPRRLRGHALRRALLVSILALAVAAPGVARATAVRDLGITQLADRSEAVVKGRVIDQRVVRVDGQIYTESLLQVDECWRGPCDKTVVIQELGGELDGVGLLVAGIRPLKAGEEVVLFLRQRAAGARAPVGLAQGVFRLAPGTGEAVRDLRGLRLIGGPQGIRTAGIERWRVAELRSLVRESARHHDANPL